MYETDAIDHRCLDSRFTDRGQRLIYESDRNLDENGGGDPAERWKLLNVALSGGAPWGFTLRGGLEHGEPLIITKVEEGSKAAAVRLQAGDELVSINEVPLSGYRQEAICLVKGSHRTLTLVVKRRNEPMSRPHSWHSTKFNENQSDTAKAQHTPLPVWQTRYDASSFSSDLTAGWHQTNLRRVSDQFSSLGSMDSLEHSSHPYSSGRLSPSKSNANSTEHLGGGKRDSAYSSFSTSSGTPDYTLSKSNTASTENMLYKVNQWDSGSRSSNGRNSQNLADGVRLDERIGYLQLPSGSSGRESPRTEEQSGHRYPGSGRASIGPIWHIPDTKKTIAPSPPPPTPPTRSDSFAATKVHEKGLVPSYTEGTGNHAQSKLQGKGLEKAMDVSESTLRIYHGSESSLDTCQTYNPPPKSETLNPYIATESYNHPTQNLNSNKTYSLSSTDVRAGLPSYTQMPYHRRQYSDESTFHAPSRTPTAPKPQNVGGCYSSMQELPTNYHAQHHGQNQIKRPTASVSNTASDQNPDTNSSSRYYCITSRQHPQGTPEASLVRVEDWKANSAMETTHSGVERSQGPPKDKNGAPQVSQHLTNNKDSNEYYRQVDGQHRANTSVSIPGHLLDDEATNVLDSRRNNKSNVATNADPHSISYPPVKQSEPGRMARPLRSRESSQEYLACKSESKSSPPKNPMLHSLSQESGRVGGGQGDVGSAREPTESIDPQVARQMRHNERFATTLRNEIQMRRAKLQKSRSTAALGGSPEAEEEPSVWKSAENSSSSFGSFTSTYKDHLKEAQARVLKATSFKRRDLEPVLLEHPGAEVMSVARRDTPPLPSVSEGPPSKPAAGGNQLTRICGRKRIPAEKKVRSFSEPEKMNEVGVNEELPPIDSSVSLAGRRKFFEAIGKPAYPKPVPKQTADDPGLAKPGGKPQSVESEGTWRDSNTKASSTESSKDGPDSLQRLGTFAEYEATWNIQRKPVEPWASGRYHSADNILDSGVEERSKPSCFHERSRSSPSDDFYGQNIPVQERKSAEFTSLHDCSSRITREGSNSLESKQNQEPTPSYLIGGDLERNLSDPLSTQYKSPANPAGPPVPDHSILAEPSSSTNHKSPVSQRPPLPRLDKYRCPEAAPPVCTSEDRAAASQSPLRDASSAPVPPPVFWKEPKHSKGPKTEEEHRPEATPLHPSSPSGPPAHRATGLTQPTGAQPTMEGHRSPSPQFAPQRLTDQPPVSVSLHDETPGRMDMVTDDNITVKKVPIKIVRSESNAENESRDLHPSAEVLPSPLGAPGSPLSSLGSPEQSSLFCTYTRQREQGPEEQAPAVGPQKQQEPSGTVAGPQEARDQLKGSCNGVTSGNFSTPSLSEEDEKRKVLTRDIIDKDKSLADILDQSKMRTTMDLMEGLFPQGEQLMEEADQRRRAAPKQASSRTSDNRREEAGPTEAAAAALVTSSAYYSTSAPKAELLIKMKDMQGQSVEVDSEEELGKDNDSDLASKKHELIASLSRKLQVLQEARESLRQDVHDNDALGEEVEATVQAICKPNELEKFRMFVGDLDKVVSLLLSLSGRLARVENALNSLEEDATLEERRTLTEKRKLLIRQHEDAKELKENLDRRERLVYTILDACLPGESLADYEHFVKMKSALIIEQRKLEDKIKLGEEQLKCLVDSLPIDQRAGI